MTFRGRRVECGCIAKHPAVFCRICFDRVIDGRIFKGLLEARFHVVRKRRVVDRTGDVFRHANLAGTAKNGGVLALMGDDHTAESSTTAHPSEYHFIDVMIPVLNPAGVQEVLDYGLYGWAMSRFTGAWVALKTMHETIESTAAIAARLEGFVQKLAASELHFVGHSLGGLVIHRLLERFPAQPPGRAVFLGTPCVASRAAESASRFAPIAHLMGQSVTEELVQPRTRRWTHSRPLGVVAGSQPLGVGQPLAHFDEPNDGTVAVSETRMPGATAHIVLPVSHPGILMSARVAHELGLFPTQGHLSLR